MPEEQKMVDIDTSGPGAEIEIPETMRFTENGQPLTAKNSNRTDYEA